MLVTTSMTLILSLRTYWPRKRGLVNVTLENTFALNAPLIFIMNIPPATPPPFKIGLPLSLEEIYLLVFLLNVFNAFFTPTSGLIIPHFVAKDEYRQAIN